MKYISYCALIPLFISIIGSPLYGQSNTDVDNLLKTGREFIEKGEYVKAVDCSGKILAALGNETNDPKITAFCATVQAYGLLHSEPYTGSDSDKIAYKRQIAPLAKRYLRQAIELDPTWEFPKKLLKEIEITE